MIRVTLGGLLSRCLDDYEAVEEVIQRTEKAIRDAVQGTEEASEEALHKTGAGEFQCSPCAVCQVKAETVTTLLDGRKVPHSTRSGESLDVYDRMAIYMSMVGETEEELN